MVLKFQKFKIPKIPGTGYQLIKIGNIKKLVYCPRILKASNVSVNFTNDTQNSKTKVLATLGLGNINIGNTEDSDTKMLNRDIENNEVDIYDVESHQGLSVELDTNMLTEKGRQKIAEDLLKSNMIVNTVKLIATDPELAKQLNSDNLTPSQKEDMLDEITGAVMVKLGYSENSNVLVSTDATGQDSKEIKGFISTETDNSYINDKNINSTEDLVTTAGHEASSYIDIQEGMDITQNREDNNLYSDNFGENLASYTNFALDVTGQGSMATGNTHNSGQVTSTPSVFNDNTFAVNNAEFAGLDKEKGDNMPFLIPVAIGLVGLAESLNAPTSEEDIPTTTPFEDATQAGKDVVQNIRDNPDVLADGLSNAGVIADAAAASILRAKNPRDVAKVTILSVIGAGYGIASEAVSPSEPDEFLTDRQWDIGTSYIKEPYGTFINIGGKQIRETLKDD